MRTLLIGATLGALALSAASLADPIHRIENDAYWHHDSGWVFPQRLGEFEREGAAQDVAGSRDAVAHYVRVWRGERVVADVDVFPADSAAENVTLDAARAALVADVDGAVGEITDDKLELRNGLVADRVRFFATDDQPSQALYFVRVAEWRVRIRVRIPAVARPVADALDGFVEAQRWDTLAPHLLDPR
jgi:hypothetical protein